MQPVRILHVLGRLDYGGIESMLMNIYRKIDRSKIQFDFVIHTTEECDYSSEIIQLGGKIYSAPKFNGANIKEYLSFWNLFYKNNTSYKIVHGHMRSTASIYLLMAKRNKVHTISHSHSTGSRGNFLERVAKGIMQVPIKYFADYYFACSEEAAIWLYGKKIVSKKQYKLLKNSIDLDKYEKNIGKKDKFKEQYSVDKNFVIGHVGSFTEPKNHKFIIDVFQEYIKIQENALLILIGDGHLKKEIKNNIDQMNLRKNVVFVGSVDNVHEYLKSMDVFIFPSLFEGLGIALIEAQAAGVKSIVSEKIPQEAIQTGIVEKVDLKCTPTEWANVIYSMSQKENVDERAAIDDLRKADYDVKIEADKLQEFYLKLSTNKN